MSDIAITFGAATSARAGNEQALPPIAQTEVIASSASSQTTTMTANQADVAHIENAGAEDVWVHFSPSPTAAIGTTHLVQAGQARDFAPLEAGMKCALINGA